MRVCIGSAAAAAVIALAPGLATAQEPASAYLGRVELGAPCRPDVQADLDRGVALLHHMTYPVAYSAFEAVTGDDPDCALAYWGMAMSLFQPLWPNRPGAEELERGWRLVQEARARATADRRERGLIEAAAAFFDPAGDPDYWTRIDRWAAAHADLYADFPEDREVRAFFALSHLATASRDGTPADHHERAARVLEEILREEPDHPGAVHYTIHANDFDGRQGESLDVVRRYGDIAPRNPHALHMPTHIFVRLGAWRDVIEWNERAAEAALAQRVGPSGAYIWDEYPHAVEYLAYAHLQMGDDRAAREVIADINATRELQPSFKTAFHLASTAARYALERKDWPSAAELPARTPDYLEWDLFPWPEAMVWHARGVGSARTGDAAGTAESLRQLGELEARAAEAGEAYFATQVRILLLEVTAWDAFRAGEAGRAVEVMRAAVALEEETPKHPVTPGATIPAREMLGDLHAELGQPALAIEAYTAVARRTPGRLDTLLGLARASEASGDASAAAAWYRRLLDLAVAGSDRDAVAEARAYLEGGR